MMSYKKIFWGVVFIILGTLFTLKNLGVVSFSWIQLFRLWPVLLILWGISIIPIKNLWKLIISFAVIVATFIATQSLGMPNSGFKWLTKVNHVKHKKIHKKVIITDDDTTYYYLDKDGDTVSNVQSEQYFSATMNDAIKIAKLSIDVAAGKFDLHETTEVNLIEVNKFGDASEYLMNTIIKGKQANIELTMKDGSNIEINDFDRGNKMDIALNTEPVWEIDLDVGAAEVDFDLSLN